MGKFQVMNHPLIQHKLTIIRDKNCGTREFREVVNEISTLLAFEVSRDMPLEDIKIETPMGTANSKCLSGKKSCNCSNSSCGNWDGRWNFRFNSSS